MRIAIAGATGMIGSRLVALARSEGHDVVELSRGSGIDLVSPAPGNIENALAGVETVVDVTNIAGQDQRTTAEFFTTVAHNLGRAAAAAGVARTVLLSIVGTDLSPDFGYYVAKNQQEQITRAEAPGPVVLRATQFHEFAGQTLGWNRDGDVVRVMDVPSQPVDATEVVRLLLDLATGEANGDVDLAGPRVERLVDQVRQLVERGGERLAVEAVEGPASMAGGSMLPGPGAVIRGVDWETWLARQPQQHLSRH